jgi:hypothetical protein
MKRAWAFIDVHQRRCPGHSVSFPGIKRIEDAEHRWLLARDAREDAVQSLDKNVAGSADKSLMPGSGP